MGARRINREIDMVRARIRNAAAALALAGAVALSGCSSTFTAQPYTPGVGTNVDAGPVKARALVLVTEGDSARLTGSIVSLESDTLVSISGQAQDASFNDVGNLTFPQARIDLGANKLVPLTDLNLVTTSGELKPGLTAQLELKFEKSGSATVVVPVLGSKDFYFSTMSPAATPSK